MKAKFSTQISVENKRNQRISRVLLCMLSYLQGKISYVQEALLE